MNESPDEAWDRILHEDAPLALDEDGAHRAAFTWLAGLVGGGDLRVMWAGCDANYRLFLARSWLSANRQDPGCAVLDCDEVAAGLAVEVSSHDLWDLFAETQLAPLRRKWPWIDLANLGFLTHLRVVALDYELVIST